MAKDPSARNAGDRTTSPSSNQLEPLPADAAAVIGRLLGDAREDAGLSQTAAARALGVAQSRIAKLELGRRQLLFAEAVLLAALYGVSLERLDPRKNSPRPVAGRRRRIDLPRALPIGGRNED